MQSAQPVHSQLKKQPIKQTLPPPSQAQLKRTRGHVTIVKFY